MSVISEKAFCSLFDYPDRVGNLCHGVWTTGKKLDCLLRCANYSSLISRSGDFRILEIGTALGQTSLNLARAFPLASIVTLDIALEDGIREGQINEMQSERNLGKAFMGTPEEQRIRQIRGTIDESELLSETFDAFYIDGLHSYEGVLRDTYFCLSIATDNAVIVWDDWRVCVGVAKLVNHLNNAVGDWICNPEHVDLVFLMSTEKRRKELIKEMSHLWANLGGSGA